MNVGGCEVQEGRGQMDTTQDICKQIARLRHTNLSDHSILVMQTELQLMQRGSYYLKIQREDLVPTPNQQQPMVQLHDSVVLSLIDQRKLRGAIMTAKTKVKIVLAFLQMLYEEIVRNCRDLDDFIVKHMQGLVDGDTAASVQQKLQQTHQYLRDFERRRTHTLGPLNLQNLIPNMEYLPIPQLSGTVVMKMPVIFDKSKLCITSNTAFLCWDIIGEEPKEPDEQFEVHIKILHPTIDNHGQFSKCTSKSYNMEVSNLISGRYYEFSVKRVDTVSLVYGQWVDTITLRTSGIFEWSRADQSAEQ